MLSNVFTYGTLMFPEVIQSVLGRDMPIIAPQTAVLAGYNRYCVQDAVFPGIIPDAREYINGVLYQKVSETALRKLDFFESDFYDRVNVKVTTDTGDYIDAWAYIVNSSKANVLSRDPWSPDEFREKHIDSYVSRVRGWTNGS